jgi:hypothetical protein
MALNRLEEARSTLQRAVDAKADNLFVDQLLYELAFLNGDAEGMRRQLKWSEGKPSEYLGSMRRPAPPPRTGKWRRLAN